MPDLKQDLRRQPWNWRRSGGTWILTTRTGGARVILGIIPMQEGPRLVVPKGAEDSRLIDLTPEHPIARILEEVPGLFEICNAVAARPIADGQELIVDAARALLARIEKEQTNDAAA